MSHVSSSTKRIMLLLLAVLMISSCSVRRFIPSDESLLKSTEVKLTSETSHQDVSDVKSELQGLLRPKPNSMFLGMRSGLLVHYKAQRERPGFLNKYLNKKIGEAPVYLSDVDSSRTIDLIYNRLENNGFFDAQVSSSVKQRKQLASLSYHIKLGDAYRLEKYKLDTDSIPILKEIEKSLEDTEIVQGSRFSLDLLKAERERIDDHLKAQGYYNFNTDFLILKRIRTNMTTDVMTFFSG